MLPAEVVDEFWNGVLTVICSDPFVETFVWLDVERCLDGSHLFCFFFLGISDDGISVGAENIVGVSSGADFDGYNFSAADSVLAEDVEIRPLVALWSLEMISVLLYLLPTDCKALFLIMRPHLFHHLFLSFSNTLRSNPVIPTQCLHPNYILIDDRCQSP